MEFAFDISLIFMSSARLFSFNTDLGEVVLVFCAAEFSSKNVVDRSTAIV